MSARIYLRLPFSSGLSRGSIVPRPPVDILPSPARIPRFSRRSLRRLGVSSFRNRGPADARISDILSHRSSRAFAAEKTRRPLILMNNVPFHARYGISRKISASNAVNPVGISEGREREKERRKEYAGEPRFFTLVQFEQVERSINDLHQPVVPRARAPSLMNAMSRG